jgi:hypothetical protein
MIRRRRTSVGTCTFLHHKLPHLSTATICITYSHGLPVVVATVRTGVFANLSNKIAKIAEKFENVDDAKS